MPLARNVSKTLRMAEDARGLAFEIDVPDTHGSIRQVGTGTAVITDTGYGDGSYNVYAQIVDEDTCGHRVKAIKVVFIEDEDDE